MTEEEKKAIETLQYLCSDDCINKDIIKTIVKLIEKLQKENEELKEDNLGIREENIKLVNCHISYERYTGLDFLLPDKFKYAIPKDKIREKLEKIEKEKIQYYDAGQPLIYMLLKNQLKSLIEEE